MGGHVGLCVMWSFINLVRLVNFNDAKNDNCGLSAIADCENTRFWLGMGFFCDVLSSVLGWLPEWLVFLYPLGVMGGVVCGDPVGVSTGVALCDPQGFPTKDAPIRIVVFHL